jgi:hypothetical protein
MKCVNYLPPFAGIPSKCVSNKTLFFPATVTFPFRVERSGIRPFMPKQTKPFRESYFECHFQILKASKSSNKANTTLTALAFTSRVPFRVRALLQLARTKLAGVWRY